MTWANALIDILSPVIDFFDAHAQCCLTKKAHPQPRKNLPRLPTTQKYESANHRPQNCNSSGCWVQREAV